MKTTTCFRALPAALNVALLLMLAVAVAACDSADSGNSPGDTKRERADELTQRIRALQSDNSKVSAHEALHEIDNIEAESKADGLGLGTAIEHARLLLGERLRREVQEFTSNLRDESREALQKSDWRRYAAYADLFEAYVSTSEYRQRAVERMEYTPDSMRDTAQEGTAKLLRENIPPADIALSRNDYAKAARHLAKVIESAWIEEAVIQALEHELEQVRLNAELQAEGELPPPTPEFSRSEAGISNAGISELLPRGERGVQNVNSSLFNRGVQLVRGGELDIEVPYFGGTAKPVPPRHGTRIEFLVRRPAGEHWIEFRAFTSDLPPATTLAYRRQIPGLTPDERAALIVDAINNGLEAEAGEMAFKLRRIEPGVRDEVDLVLSQKWGVEVPEGGFPEHEGRVVRALPEQPE